MKRWEQYAGTVISVLRGAVAGALIGALIVGMYILDALWAAY